MEIPDALVAHVREWLGEAGVTFFRKVKEHHGRVNATISVTAAEAYHKGEDPPEPKPLSRPRRPFPHPIHFREGMLVRNCLRDSDLTDGWTDHDFDNNWADVVEKAIEE